ncbi:MAG: AAA family ATPase [Puniceicoccales bacterium]|jgi:predicted ATP-binding protein involved in virulence|nr:AAA family ATPase [Puniceicoccales bacterium]
MFHDLTFKNFPPFADQTIEFPQEREDKQLAETHILTGVNGTGKTRLLSVLAAVLGNEEHLEKRAVGLGKDVGITLNAPAKPQRGYVQLNVPPIVLNVDVATWETCPTIPAFAYNGTAYIEDAKVVFFKPTPKPDRKICLSFARPPEQSQQLLQTIVNLLAQSGLEMRNAKGNPTLSRFVRLVSNLEKTISEITGRDFQFNIAAYGEAQISVNWGSEHGLHFSLLPDGLRSIIGWLAHAVAMTDAVLEGKGEIEDTPCIFLLDEIESHLHPSWQRKILPAFQRLFPQAQIFVATHSPFVISSVNQAYIHILKPSEKGVLAEKPIKTGKGSSYLSVVEDIMGLDELQIYDPESERLLREFEAKRDDAYKQRDKQKRDEAQREVQKSASEIAERCDELHLIMGQEIAQMNRLFSAAQ